LTGTGDPYGTAEFKEIPFERPAPAPTPRSPGNGRADLPVYASAEGGPSGMLVTREAMDWIARPEPLLNARDAFAVYAVGTSMEPRYDHGDMLLVHPTRPSSRGDDVLLLGAQVNGALAALVRRLVGWDEAAWTVKQHNPAREHALSRADWPHAHLILGRFNRR
jgi:phage repressor protein C with HTH and peptisase S24 domain